MAKTIPIKIKGRIVPPHKALENADLASRNVLTNSPWDFVELWLKREKQKNALFYWNQAREFHNASYGLPRQSSPLLHYYSFMNAVKALLTSKGITFHQHHGVTSHNMRSPSEKISITNEGVKIKTNGILPSLSNYLRESETNDTHSLKELFFNLPYIHRTYCLTYKTQTDMFIPIKDAHFACDKSNGVAFFKATLSSDFSNAHVVKRLPPSFEVELKESEYTIRSVDSVPFARPSRPTGSDILQLLTLHKQIRSDLSYINGSQTLWYIKGITAGPARIKRTPCTLTLAAMHRLSELSRYKPLELDIFPSGQKNWLLSEFIQQSPAQFFDEISSEITGHQFLIPNVRPAT